MVDFGSSSYFSGYFCGRQTNHKYAGVLHRIYYQLFSVNMNKRVLNKLSDGSSSEFQRKVSLYAIILLLVLMSLIGGPFFANENWRLIWLGALMATAIHFFMYYFVHGKSMIYLGIICTVNVAVGYIFQGIPVTMIAYIDAAIKLIFGIYLLFFSKPSKQK